MECYRCEAKNASIFAPYASYKGMIIDVALCKNCFEDLQSKGQIKENEITFFYSM